MLLTSQRWMHDGNEKQSYRQAAPMSNRSKPLLLSLSAVSAVAPQTRKMLGLKMPDFPRNHSKQNNSLRSSRLRCVRPKRAGAVGNEH